MSAPGVGIGPGGLGLLSPRRQTQSDHATPRVKQITILMRCSNLKPAWQQPALGLDPGLGFIHLDTPARDSLACDLMEPVRPQVDAFVLDWITREPLKREWFFEQRDGTCRLMASFAAQLSETAPSWGRAVGLFAEWVARALWLPKPKSTYNRVPATHLTQRCSTVCAKPKLPLNRERLHLLI